MTARPSTAAPVLAAIAIVLPLLVVVYAAGYFWLGKTRAGLIEYPTGAVETIQLRCYKHQFAAMIFSPAAAIESWITGVVTCTNTGVDGTLPVVTGWSVTPPDSAGSPSP